MRINRVMIVALLITAGTTPLTTASLSWSWSHINPNVLATPDDTINVFIEIVNDASSSEDLSVGSPIIGYAEPTWSLYYQFSSTLPTGILLSPGESQVVSFFTLTPTNSPPLGSLFSFDIEGIFPNAVITPDNPLSPVSPDEGLRISIIPEPACIVVFISGLLLTSLKRRRT